MPGVVTNSRSSPSSLKNPMSRATRTGRSWTAFMIATWGLVFVSGVMAPPPGSRGARNDTRLLETARGSRFLRGDGRVDAHHRVAGHGAGPEARGEDPHGVVDDALANGV